jgi:hypothetical protein
MSTGVGGSINNKVDRWATIKKRMALAIALMHVHEHDKLSAFPIDWFTVVIA